MFAEDLTVFFEQSEFAHAGTHTPPGGVAAPCEVLLDEPSEVFAEYAQARARTITFAPSLVASVVKGSVFTLPPMGAFVATAHALERDDGRIATVTVRPQ